MKSIISLTALTLIFLSVPVLMSAQDIENKPSPPMIKTSGEKIDSTHPGLIITRQSYSPPADSLKKGNDTTSVLHADSMKIDSVRSRFLPGMGQVVELIDTTDVLHQKQFLWNDAKNIGDMIWMLPGFFYRDLGEAGKWGQLNAFGVDGRSISILLDGRPMNDPVSGGYNLLDLPLEFIDHTEILNGSTSFSVSGEDGMVMNFVSRSYNSYRPMTKIRFVQDPKGTILTDGLFTQNVARGLNLMIGFQRTVTLGRFANADLDAWNVRTRLRYNVSDRFNIALTDFYTKASNGLNGGIDPSLSPSFFDETSAIVVNQHARDNRSRRDVTLSAIARIVPDTSSATHVSMYYSTLEREYLNPSNSIHDSTNVSFWGIQLQQHLSFDPLHVTIGGNVERRQSDSTRTLPSHIETEKSLSTQAELRLFTMLVPSLTVRSTSLDGDHTLSLGIGVKSMLAEWLTIFADASKYDRFPTLQERYWRDSVFIRSNGIVPEKHSTLQGGFNIHVGSNFQMNLTLFQQTVKDAIVYQPAVTNYGSPAIGVSNVNEVNSSGVNGRIMFDWHHFEVIGVFTMTRYLQDDSVKTMMPDILLSGEIAYRGNILFEHWDGKVGLRTRFFDRQRGMQFDPQTLSYVPYSFDLLGRSTTIDLFMMLKIGDAHISLSWNNILNAGYMLGPLYPMQGRTVRLGVNWVFMD